jgi:hypothetical protein
MKRHLGFSLAVAALTAVPSWSSAAIVPSPYFEGFSPTFDPGSTPLQFNQSGNPVPGLTNPDDLAPSNTFFNVSTPGGNGNDVFVMFADFGPGDFTVSTRIKFIETGGLDLDYSGGRIGVTAGGAIVPGATDATISANPSLVFDQGYKLFLENPYSENNNNLVLRRSGVDIASVSLPADLTESFDVADFELTLTGTYQPGGNLDLVGTLTDILGTSNSSASVSATVLPADQTTGTTAGIFTYDFGGNSYNPHFDYLSVNVIPEPSAAALASLVACLTGAPRGRRR